MPVNDINYNISDDLTAKDADTYKTSKDTVRLLGVNALETAKFLPEEGKITPAERGANTQTKLVTDLLRDLKYDQPILSGKKDVYNRDLGDLAITNSGRKTATNELLYQGLIAPSSSANEEQLGNYVYGNLFRANRKATGKSTSQDLALEKLHDEMYAGGKVLPKLLTNSAKDFNQADRRFFFGPANVGPDETDTGEARNNWTAGLNQGFTTAKQGLFGTLEMIGEKTGIDWMRDAGTRNVVNYDYQLSQMPFLRNGEAFDEKGNWKLDSFGKATDYLIGQAAASAPQMLTSLVAGLAAPITMGASLSVPTAMYIGNTWNGQDKDNKSATAAIFSGITQAALDQLALPKGLLPKGLDITKPATQTLVKNELVKKGLAASDEIAEKMVLEATQKSVAEVSKVLRAESLKNALGPKAIAREFGKCAVKESWTEGLQELAAMMGEKVTFNPFEGTEKERNIAKNRVLNAMVGGAALGGTINAAHTALMTATVRPDNVYTENTDTNFRDTMMAKHGWTEMPSTLTVLNSPTSLPENEADLNRMAAPEETKRSISGAVSSWWSNKGVSSLWDKWSNTVMQGKSHVDQYMGTLSTLLGSSRAMTGGSIDETQNLISSNVFSKFGTKEDLSSSFGGLKVEAVSNVLSQPAVVSLIERALDKKGNLFSTASEAAQSLTNVNLGEYAQYKDAILKYADKLEKTIEEYNKVTGKKLTVKEFLENKPMMKSKIARNLPAFAKELQVALNITPQEANSLAQNIINNENVNDMEDILDELLNPRDDIKLSKEDVIREMNKPENKARFNKYLSHDILDNVYSLANKAGALHVNQNLIGKDGHKLAMLIQKSLELGNISSETAAFQAKELKDWLAMRNGTYRPALNPYAKAAYDTVNFLTTITSLPLAAVSSTVEFAQIYRNLTRPQAVKATKLLLTGAAKELKSIFEEIGSSVTSQVKISESTHRSELSAAGYLKEGGIAHRNDVTQAFFQKWNEGFFKLTGLTSITTITRYARLGIASDAIQHWISTMKENDPLSEAYQTAYSHLTRIGVDTSLFIDKADQDGTVIDELRKSNMHLATYNFVNEAMVIPTQLNRPKFYSDPYLKLFTTFQGYTSAFTANILPRLLGDLRHAGSEEQKNAAAVIAMMFALSLMAMTIKDLIKYGESPPEWLKDDKKLQRVIGQMGILGTGQRVWDTVDPMFPDKEKNASIGRQLWKNLADQSPQLSFINKVDEAISAKPDKQIEKVSRLLPIFGTSPQFAKYLQKELGN